MPHTLSVATLRCHSACATQRDRFAAACPDGQSREITVDWCVSAAAEYDWDWAAKHLLNAKPRRIYNAADAAAWRIYEAAKSDAQRIYDAAMAEPRRIYAVSRSEAGRSYKAALAKAGGIYDVARSEAGRIYDAALAKALRIYVAAQAAAFARAYVSME